MFISDQDSGRQGTEAQFIQAQGKCNVDGNQNGRHSLAGESAGEMEGKTKLTMAR